MVDYEGMYYMWEMVVYDIHACSWGHLEGQASCTCWNGWTSRRS